MTRLIAVLPAAISLFFATAATAADGEFDLNFGPGGQVGTDEFANPDVESHIHESVVGLPDGAALYYGNTPFEVHRYTVTGKLDPNFGTNGKTDAGDIGVKSESNGVMTVGNDGTIYTAARTTDTEGTVVCKFTAQGLPSLFADTQTACTSVATFPSAFEPVAMAMDATGGLLLLELNGSLIRFQPGGTLDTNFALPNGLFDLPTLAPDQSARPSAITLGPTGEIYVVGHSVSPLTSHAYVVKLQIDPNTGSVSPDPAFNSGAPLEPSCGPVVGSCKLASVDVSSNVLTIAGTNTSMATILRLDATSGQPHSAATELPLPGDATSLAVGDAILQQNGKLILVGTSVHPSSEAHGWLARVNLGCNASTLDTTFNSPNGFSSFEFEADTGVNAQDIATGQGRIFLAGHKELKDRLIQVATFANAESVFDTIFTDGFETCN